MAVSVDETKHESTKSWIKVVLVDFLYVMGKKYKHMPLLRITRKPIEVIK